MTDEVNSAEPGEGGGRQPVPAPRIELPDIAPLPSSTDAKAKGWLVQAFAMAFGVPGGLPGKRECQMK